MAIYEVRQYKVKPGKATQWREFMDSTIIPFVTSKGMVVAASFQHETDESVYIWLRRFENEAELDSLYKAVYEDEHWKNVLSPQIGDMLDRESSVIQRVIPTSMSVLQ